MSMMSIMRSIWRLSRGIGSWKGGLVDWRKRFLGWRGVVKMKEFWKSLKQPKVLPSNLKSKTKPSNPDCSTYKTLEILITPPTNPKIPEKKSSQFTQTASLQASKSLRNWRDDLELISENEEEENEKNTKLQRMGTIMKPEAPNLGFGHQNSMEMFLFKNKFTRKRANSFDK